MSLEKAIKYGKERRKKYYDSRSFDASCRAHGRCPYCANGRQHKHKKNMLKASKDHQGRFRHLNSCAISLTEGEEIPPFYDFEMVTKEVCDCGNKEWEPGDLMIAEGYPPMRVNYCTNCRAVQMKVRKNAEVHKNSSDE